MLHFILADLRRLWAGSIVIIALVALATALGVTVTLQERALRLGSARAADKFDVIVGAPGSETQLLLSTVFLQPAALPLLRGSVLADLTKDPRVVWAAPVGFGDSFSGYPIIGTTSTLVQNTSSGLSDGRLFTSETEAVIGSAVDLPTETIIKPMHGTADTGGHAHTELAYTVVGKLAPTGTPWDRAIFVPISAVWHIHGMRKARDHAGHDHDAQGQGGDDKDGHDDHAHDNDGHDREEGGTPATTAGLNENFDNRTPGIPAVLIKPKSIADAYRLRQDYRGETSLAVFPGEVLTRLYATLGDAKIVLTAVAIGAQALVAASLVLVTILHLSQRRRQIGALRALGAPRLSVSLIVWLEPFLLILVGIAFGFVLGYSAALTIAKVVTQGSGVRLPVEFARGDFWSAFLLVIFAALLALIPAVLAYRQSPAAALRA
ncbi:MULTISPECIES: ABC transporter permease [unclassified Chelatococcus]|uniref:ABC transporter permease n=1 Tax=unclassified Chelatococcus TaxID=2638111 RepID=UPI001BCD4FD1|nr:ABC transporter permease [Chelatococcus sp.]MBS7742102.1 ABC transporter permease [Chelatococcus sp. HY11]CAH1647999.1 Membrane protein [Hyphomicrobiales bacterium]MBX3542780.1 ABC transporter permease [Chelatococcus sp.]MCO5075005.1 ABC transporter permease [Chelatococcus sp.]CAH1690183.1 Membrane protein [Hyphomicrobiales bacterium]